MNYIKISKCDIANGPGVRCVLWVSGCRCNCPGCHNPETHDFAAGQLFSQAAYDEISEILSRPFISGITISGGNPTDIANIDEVSRLAERIKADFPDKTIWVYSGYYIEEFRLSYPKRDAAAKLLRNIDVLVDGPFIQEARDITLKFRGSRNQRLIDVPKTIAAGHVVEWEE